MFPRAWLPVAGLATCLLLAACGDDSPADPGGSANAYVTSDLAGAWDVHSLASGAGEPWWERARATIAASGRVNATTSYNDGGTDAIVADFAVARDGIVTSDGATVMRGHLSKLHNLLVLTDTWEGSPYAVSTELKVGVKMGTGYVPRDLTGTWHLSTLASGPGSPWWTRGTVTVTDNGNYSFALDEYDAGASTGSSFFDLTADGRATTSRFAGSAWSLDETRSLLVGTSTWAGSDAGTTELAVMVKAPATCTAAQLAGRWECSALATGPGAPRWTRATLTVDEAGHFTGTTTNSVGGPAAATDGTLSVTADGIVSRLGAPAFVGYVDATRTVLVATDTWQVTDPGTSELQVWTRMD